MTNDGMQPWARNLSTGAAWSDVNSYGNVFGLEPNYVSSLFLPTLISMNMLSPQ